MAAHRLDRLSALVTRFAVAVTVDPVHAANLAIHPAHAPSDVSHVVFVPDGGAADDAPGGMPPAFRARVEWGGPTNPLVTALPGRIEVAARPGDGIAAVATLIVDEARERRCGSGAVLDRLGEVLLVRLLRERLDAGTAEVGLLAGLADPRIAPAIVAMHDRPGHGWRAESLAELAGLSTSRFSARFAERVGTTPMSYLRRWRMVLARQDIERGDRVQRVAARYGYASSEALGRAFRRLHGDRPLAFRGGRDAFALRAVDGAEDARPRRPDRLGSSRPR